MSTPELRAYNNAKALRYRLRHPERKRRSSREWNRRNHGRVLVTTRDWHARSKEHERLYLAQKCKRDPSYSAAVKLRRRLWEIVTQNIHMVRGTWAARLGISLWGLRQWLTDNFEDGMSWENYGRDGWEIDHVKPCASYDLTKEEQVCACFNYRNLRPLWAHQNQSKNGYS